MERGVTILVFFAMVMVNLTPLYPIIFSPPLKRKRALSFSSKQNRERRIVFAVKKIAK